MTAAHISAEVQKTAVGGPGRRPDREAHWFSLAQILLVVLLFAAPLTFGAVETWAWATLAIVASLLLPVWALGSAQENKVRIQWTPYFFLGGLFFSLGMMQLVTGRTLDRIATREALLKLAADLVIFFLTVQLFAWASSHVWHRFGIAVVLYGSVVSLFALLQFFSRPDRIYWSVKPQLGGYIFGPYVNHNHYAGLMEMVIPIGATFLLGQSKGPPWRWVLGLASILSISTVPLSGSRAGSISLLVESALLGAILLGKSRRFHTKHVALTTIAVAFSLALFVWVAPQDVSGRLQTIVRSPDLTYGDRRQMTLDSLRMFEDHPWVGVGLGSFSTAYPQYQSALGDIFVDHAHNDFAEILAETGVVGTLLILVSFSVFFVTVFSGRNESVTSERRWIALGATVGCCGLLCHSLADFNFHIPANAAWFAFSAGIAQLS